MSHPSSLAYSDYSQILMAEQAEATFLKNFVGVIANQPVSYPDDFQAPPEQSLRKIPVIPVRFLQLCDTADPPISFISGSSLSPTHLNEWKSAPRQQVSAILFSLSHVR